MMDRHGQRAMIVAQFAVMAILVAVFAIEEDDCKFFYKTSSSIFC